MTKTTAKILVAPLDWGMGHTTRCMPLIGYLQQLGYSVAVAGNDWQLQLLSSNFTGLELHYLKGYGVRYGGSSVATGLNVALQVPGIMRTIKAEHNWLLSNAAIIGADYIISDNRYGFYHPAIPSAIITHQLQVLSGAGALADGLLRKLHYRFLNCFDEIWVPDNKEASMAGRLAHPGVLPPNTFYIGWLSQFERMERNEIAEEDYSLILLSGPEPQRGIWEQQVLQQLQNTVGKIMLVSGNTSATQPIATGPNVTWHRQLTGQQLYKAIKGARLVICRSGYSSLMDLALLRKRAVVVPTPGQTEQQYLAGTLSSAGWLTAMKQDGFNLNEAIKLGLSLVHPDYVPDAFSYYRAVLKQFVSKNR